jgi:hypothetical protein
MTQQIVEAVAGKLADPEKVAAIAGRPENELVLPAVTMKQWEPTGLSDSYPAVTLLFAELGVTDAAQRPRAHAHLAAGLAADAPPPVPALYGGAVSFGFAAHAAAVATGGYTTLLSRLDQAIVGQVRHWAHDRRSAGAPVGDWSGYDVITGGAGLGRYLLARHERTGDTGIGEVLREVLDVLVDVALAADTAVDGRRVPAWWVHHGPAHDGGHGHLNLGLAHGLGGPLALLALAWRAGVRVDRHAEAATAIVALLDDWRLEDQAGPHWPYWVFLDGADDTARIRDVWCYGAAGMGRALYLAGAAFGEKEWRDTGDAAVRGAFADPGEHAIHDFALCHGWAGLLHIASRMAHDTGDPVHTAAADGFAARISEAYDPDAPFGFRYRHPSAPKETDRPGFLEGAAGIALALHCHATGAPPRTGWDAALLLD